MSSLGTKPQISSKNWMLPMFRKPQNFKGLTVYLPAFGFFAFFVERNLMDSSYMLCNKFQDYQFTFILTLPMPSCFVSTPHAGGVETTPLYFLNPLPLKPKVLHAIRRLFVDFRKVEMDKISLFGYHYNRPTNKYFLLIFAHFGPKTTTFLNAHKNYRCKDSTLKLSGMIDLFILNLETNFYWGGRALFFGETGGKIGLKMGKCSKFQECLGRIFPVPPRISEPV